jgi:hypothetical protein
MIDKKLCRSFLRHNFSFSKIKMKFLKNWIDTQNKKINEYNQRQSDREKFEFVRLAQVAMRPEPRDANAEYFRIANARATVKNYIGERNLHGDRARLRELGGYAKFPRFGEKK